MESSSVPKSRLRVVPAVCVRAGAALLAAMLAGGPPAARAEADGPDFYRVVGVRPGSALILRAGPSRDAERVGAIPSGADGLRNLGCQGGLSFAEWSEATPEEREAARRTRWCRVEWRGSEGWVAGWHLAEGSDPTRAQAERRVDTGARAGAGKVAFENRIVGRESIDYVVDAVAGQTLEVSVERGNRFLYFNVLAPEADTALFAGAGSATPDTWSGLLRDTGEHVVRVFLMRNAARRGETGPHRLEVSLAPESHPPLVGHVPARETRFDATAAARCVLGDGEPDGECALGVYRGQASQTVYLATPDGVDAPAERIVVFRAGQVRVQPEAPLEVERPDGEWLLRVDGRERYWMPDAVLTGG